jgi:hypothetical protein
MLVVHLQTHRLWREIVGVQPGKHHGSPGGCGDDLEKASRGLDRSRRAGGNEQSRRWRLPPTFRQGAKQEDASAADILQSQSFQPAGPEVERRAEQVEGDLPVLRHLRSHQGVQVLAGHLLDLKAVEEGAQGVGEAEGLCGTGRLLPAGREVAYQLQEFEPPPHRGDGGGQVQHDLAGLKGRLAGLEVAQGADPRRQQGTGRTGPSQEGLGEGSRRPPCRGQDDGIRKGLRTLVFGQGQQAFRQVVQERPVCGNRVPARALPAQEFGLHRVSLASASARAAGSPT